MVQQAQLIPNEQYDTWYDTSVYEFVYQLCTDNPDLFPGYSDALQDLGEIDSPAASLVAFANRYYWVPIELKQWIYDYCQEENGLYHEPQVYAGIPNSPRNIADARHACIMLTFSEPNLFPDLAGGYGIRFTSKYYTEDEARETFIEDTKTRDKVDNPELVRALRAKAFWKKYKEWLKAGYIEPAPWEGFREAPEHDDDLMGFYYRFPRTQQEQAA